MTRLPQLTGAALPWTYTGQDHSELEQRWITIGESEAGRVLVVAHTDDGAGTIQIITAQRATRKEREYYEEG